jgi:hypothetical protein
MDSLLCGVTVFHQVQSFIARSLNATVKFACQGMSHLVESGTHLTAQQLAITEVYIDTSTDTADLAGLGPAGKRMVDRGFTEQT